MSFLLQLGINSLIAGSLYALVAAGFALIYSTNKFMHFAHGGIVVISGYLFYFLYTHEFPLWYAAFSTLIYAGFFGFIIFRAVYFPLLNKKSSTVILLIASIASLILIQNILQLIFGASVKDIEHGITNSIEFYGATITILQLAIIVFSVILFFLLTFFLKKTNLGRDMRAVSDNQELAAIVGINRWKISDLSFMIGSLLAGIAGVFIVLEQNVTPFAGTQLIIKGFTGAVIGGIFSIPASIFGAYILGVAENFGIGFLPSGYKDAISFLLLFIFLLFRPEGLIGIKRRVT